MAEAHLVREGSDYLGAYVEMTDQHGYPGWLRLTEALRDNRPTAFDPDKQTSLFSEDDPVVVGVFWKAMAVLSTSTAQVLGRTLDLSQTQALLDVGGGGGAFTIELCRLYPHLTAAVFDMPFVCELTQPRINEAELSDRISVIPGDFFKEKLPTGYDTILLSMILHDWDVPDCQRLVAKCFDALPSGGTLMISELLVNDAKDGPLDAAMMSLAMLIETWGRNYTAAEYQTWLAEAGFTDISTTPLRAPGANGVVIARKP
jgi:ubiquinone/menaquinone biosynthesis C-methylase UbiE